MSKLTDFYAHKAALKEKDEATDAQWAQLEDQLIKEELLPVLAQQLKTTLSGIKSPLSLSVNYDPKGLLSISFTRNCIQTFALKDVVIDTVSEDSEQTPHEDVVDSGETDSTEESQKISRAKSVGFSVSFKDGTIIHEKKAVRTWYLALKKIGLEVICNNRSRHGAWHRVAGQDVCVVERTQTFRDDGKSPQTLYDGFYIMTQLSNDQKEKDLLELGRFMPQLGIKVIWDEEAEEVETIKHSEKPVINEEASLWNLPIKQQFYSFLVRTKSEGTAKSYTSTLDNAVRQFINAEVDVNADSVFSYTTSEDVQLCLDILNASSAFVQENDRKHHSMSAALTQYLKFIAEWEKRIND